MTHHKSIMVDQFLSFFQDLNLSTFVDGTVGAGGHAKALLEAHPEIEQFYGIDQDELALGIASDVLKPFSEKVKLIHSNFAEMKTLFPEESVDGIFMDLGVSSMQLDLPEKGFSLYKEGPLDMRMDANQSLTAEFVVNTYSEKDLGEIFRLLGEEPRWRKVAKALVEARKKKKIKTTTDLTEALKHVLTWGGRRGKKIHPMTLVFQALRIFVNDELEVVKKVIPDAISMLRPGGRLGIITFHSLEDRIVKHTFREIAQTDDVTILTKKPLIADVNETRLNPRSRSAKMRFIEKSRDDDETIV